jgi:cytidylate kinase
MINKKITIAIDGYSSCGKSTLAKALANKLNYIFIDSGAMYRGIALFCIQNNLVQNELILEEKLIKSLPSIKVSFKLNTSNDKSDLLLNGTNVEELIRKPNVANIVSKVASIKEVRQKLVSEQREMGKDGGIIMDGRDIGSVVFPKAQLKLFITAKPETRTERRFLELQSKDENITKEQVHKNLVERDYLDTHREESPLIQSKDAIVLDNTNMSQEGQLEYVLELIKNKF